MVKDIAKKHRVSQSTVNMLVVKAKKKPKFIAELFDKENLKKSKFDEVK